MIRHIFAALAVACLIGVATVVDAPSAESPASGMTIGAAQDHREDLGWD
ncbi:hypothetical protein ACFYO2_33605 [Streptomyces sp. NPDC006602]|jgi:hypothetical protein